MKPLTDRQERFIFEYTSKLQEEVFAREGEEEAAHAAPPPNMRVRPGMVVPGRMEPGYNPPWHRDNRPRVAIGANETYLG